jgi:hypothetical protein
MTMTPSTAAQVRMLADRFASWQTPYGRPDPERCPFVTPGAVISTQFHSPTFMALALYAAADLLGTPEHEAAADRYVTYYFAALRDPQPMEQRLDYPSYPFMYGMGLAAWAEFRRRHAAEDHFDAKALAIVEWLRRFRWDVGSTFRNGYGNPDAGFADCGFSEDNLNIGRGLVGYHARTGDAAALADAEALARYYVTELEPGSYRGCWSSELGTWAVSPIAISSFEHFEARPAHTLGWGFTSTGAIEFLAALSMATEDNKLRAEIAEKASASLRWQFDVCQWDDGACGLADRDDKWLGMTAGAVLSFLRLRDAGLLTDDQAAWARPRAVAARDWLVAHVDSDTVDAGGYIQVTGRSEPRPPENLAWMLSWTLLALARADEVDEVDE